MKRVWIATVQIAIVADSEAEACDGVSESMRNATGLDTDIPDWQYMTIGAQRLSPCHHMDYPDDYEFEEGEVF